MFTFVLDPAPGEVGVAFTDRWGGTSSSGFATLNLGRTDLDRTECIVENYRRVQDFLGVDTVHVVHQVHGVAVHRVTEDHVASWESTSPLGNAVPGQSPLPVADIVWTSVPGVGVGVRVADCLPAILAAPQERMVAAVHAGRVGLLAGALETAVATLRDNGASEIRAWIGPHICGECYEVPEDMAQEAGRIYSAAAAHTSWGSPSVDLEAGAREALAGEGVEEIVTVGGCTRTDPAFFSHRRDSGSGRQLAVGWVCPQPE